MRITRRLIWTAVALIATGALAGGVAYSASRSDDDTGAEERSERAFMEANLDRAAVSQAEAEAAALAAFPGTVIESELESAGPGLIWEVEIDGGTSVHEVVIDAQTGDVLGNEAEGDESSEGSDAE